MTRKKLYAICISIILGFMLLAGAAFFVIDFFVTKSQINSYLESNYVHLDQNGNNATKLLNSNYTVFLAGEESGSQKNYTAQMTLIKTLNKNYNVTELLFELPHSLCIRLNEYMEAGSEETLDGVFEVMPKNHLANNKSAKEFFRKLKDYNDGLTQNKKLHLNGLDAELSDATVKNAIVILQNIVSEIKEVPEDLQDNWLKLSNLKSDVNYSASSLKEVFGDLQDDIELSKNSLATSLDKNYADYACIVNGIYSKLYDDEKKQNKDDVMYKNFRIVYADKSNSKFFGQFSQELVYLSPKNNGAAADPLAVQINQTLGLDGKICSVRFSYKTSQRLDVNGNYVKIGQTMYEQEFNNFGNSPTSLTLLKLDGRDSIYAKQQVFINGFGKNTADLFQYVLLIEDSAAVEKLA